MILNSLLESLIYVMSHEYFLISMAATTMIGIFLGATLYDGMLDRFGKALISLVSYGLLMAATTSTRVIPLVEADTFKVHHPFSGVATVLTVSLFYFVGMGIGVFTTYLINKKKRVK